MTRAHFAEGQVLFREGDPADSVFRLLSGTVDILRELDGEPILLGTVGPGQFIGEMGVVENRPRSATARAASEIEAEILTPTEFFDQIAGSPRAARELIQRLSQRLREADDRIVSDERRSGRVHGTRKDADSPTTVDVEQSIMRISLPRIRGCSDSSAPHSGSAICRSSLAEGLLHGKGCRRCSRTSSSMTLFRSDYRATTS
jgi:CRP-like cAMP-binding protein